MDIVEMFHALKDCERSILHNRDGIWVGVGNEGRDCLIGSSSVVSIISSAKVASGSFRSQVCREKTHDSVTDKSSRMIPS